MGFWYFLGLFIGLIFIIQAIRKRNISAFKRIVILVTGICLISASLFMFQDGSAEIVARLFNL